MEYEYHELSNFFPLLGDKELKELAADIRESGLIHPICLYEGKILDGRNRYRACMLAGVKPRFVTYEGSDPVGYVVSLNLTRRHLTTSQRAVVALKLLPYYEEKARLRQVSGVKPDLKADLPEGQASDVLADVFGISGRTIRDAKFIQTHAPERLPEIESGKMTVSNVKWQVSKQLRKDVLRTIPLEELEGKFNVIIADPPWEYDANHVRGAAEKHYPTMTLDEICGLSVNDITLENAVCFLWTTNSKLIDAFKVLESWGFEFKTSMVWVKDKIGTGYYTRSKHEFVLIGVKGSFLPMTTDLPASVFMADREEHSKKPEVFYDIVEKMYPEQKYVELFARRKHSDKWEVWGNEL